MNWILEGYRGARTLKAYCAEKWFLSVYRQKTSGMINRIQTAPSKHRESGVVSISESDADIRSGRACIPSCSQALLHLNPKTFEGIRYY